MKLNKTFASACIALSSMFFVPTIASAGEWGKTGQYQGRWKFDQSRMVGQFSRPAPSANTVIIGGMTHCYNCGTIATPQGKVLQSVPRHGRVMRIDRTYREFHGRAPVLRGLAGTSILFGIHDWRRGYYGPSDPHGTIYTYERPY